MNTPINGGGPAFPIPGLQADESFNGMSLRDYFAAKAMSLCFDYTTTPAKAAQSAYSMADAMIKARSAA